MTRRHLEIPDDLNPTPAESYIIFKAVQHLVERATCRFTEEGMDGVAPPDSDSDEWIRLYLRSNDERMCIALGIYHDKALQQLRLQVVWQPLDKDGVAVKGMVSGDLPLLDGDLFLRSAERLGIDDIQGFISFNREYRWNTPGMLERIAATCLYGDKVTSEEFHEPFLEQMRRKFSNITRPPT